MPASRRARAITFAPRSWPSSPGLATSTRMGCGMVLTIRIHRGDAENAEEDAEKTGFFSQARGLLVGAEDGAEGIADLAQSGVGADGFEDVGHGVFGAFRGALQSIELFAYV